MILVRVLRGRIASFGLAVAPVVKHESVSILDSTPPDCRASDTRSELRRLEEALGEASRRLSLISSLLEPELTEVYSRILSELVQEAGVLVESEGLCAESAIRIVYEKYSSLLESTGSELFAVRAQDLRALSELILSSMKGVSWSEYGRLRGAIVLAKELNPMTMTALASAGVMGVVTATGGITSHSAIIARSRGIPYLISEELRLDEVPGDVIAILDAIEGKLILEPAPQVLDEYGRRLETYEKLRRQAREYEWRTATTIDGVRVEVLCNAGSLEEARVAAESGCEGIGLLRVEFIYYSSRDFPSEEALERIFERIATIFEGKPVIVRAPDLGADKPLPYLKLREENPALGVRGIRLLLERRNELLIPFLRAFIKSFEKKRNLMLLIPMVSKTGEIEEFGRILEEEVSKTSSRISINDFKIGIMVETPAAAINLEALASTGIVKFASIGSNDLTQYTLAADRNSPKLSNVYDDMDPAVLKLIQLTVEKARRLGVDLKICGELASRQAGVPILLGLGLRSLSVNPPLVGIIKYTISRLSYSELSERLAETLRSAKAGEDARKFAVNVLREKGVELILET